MMIAQSQYNPDFTPKLINAIGPKADPRVRQTMSSLIRHLHDFIRENELSADEWQAAIKLINSAAKMSDEKYNFTMFLSHIFGVKTLLDEIATLKDYEKNNGATDTSLLGPYYRDDVPIRENESCIFQDPGDGVVTYMHGKVYDLATKQPIAGAWIDIWQANTNGLYEQEDENQPEFNLRGKFKTDDKGHYGFYALRPTSYPVPIQGAPKQLLDLLDKPSHRPAHIHVLVKREGYQSLTTQIYDRDDPFVNKDAFVAVKDSLILDFKPIEGNPKAKLEVEFPIFLKRSESN